MLKRRVTSGSIPLYLVLGEKELLDDHDVGEQEHPGNRLQQAARRPHHGAPVGRGVPQLRLAQLLDRRP